MKLSPAADAPAFAGPNYMRIADQLRQDIIEGRCAPGTRLKMHDLADRFGVSPQPVREALQVLSGEGMVVLEPNRGARVRGLDFERLGHIYELREAIEGALTRRFAEEAALSDLRRLADIQKLHDAAVRDQDAAAAGSANMAFHALIVNHSGNTEAMELRDRYFALPMGLRKRFGYAEERWERAMREHHEMIDAFHRRDGMAAYEIASRHVRQTRDELMGQIEHDADRPSQ